MLAGYHSHDDDDDGRLCSSKGQDKHLRNLAQSIRRRDNQLEMKKRLEDQKSEDDLFVDPKGSTLLILFTNAQALETREIWARNLSVRSNLRR